MKNLRIVQFAAAALLALGGTGFAERPSLDEMAVRIGIDTWVAGRAVPSKTPHLSSLLPLYAPNVEATNRIEGKPQTISGPAAYAALWRDLMGSVAKWSVVAGDDVKVSVQGTRATSSFTFRSQGSGKDGRELNCSGRVNLTWEKRDGFWQIAREEIEASAPKTQDRPLISAAP